VPVLKIDPNKALVASFDNKMSSLSSEGTLESHLIFETDIDQIRVCFTFCSNEIM
jgi:hypothetical protein